MFFIIFGSIVIYIRFFSKSKVFSRIVKIILPQIMQDKVMVENSFLKWLNKRIIIYTILVMFEWTLGILIGSIALKILIYYEQHNLVNTIYGILIKTSSAINIFGSLSLTIIAIEYFRLLDLLTKIRMQNCSNYDCKRIDSLFISCESFQQINLKKQSRALILLPINSNMWNVFLNIKIDKYLNSTSEMWNYCSIIFCNHYKIKGTNIILTPCMLKQYCRENGFEISGEK
ncbi:hypothetical protein ACNQ1M_00630 [Mycoplasma sp. VS424B]|uniref:hypothetical protein n=3 Tax=Mycoplasma TaxID=2093 RepID=UPI003AAC2A4A